MYLLGFRVEGERMGVCVPGAEKSTSLSELMWSMGIPAICASAAASGWQQEARQRTLTQMPHPIQSSSDTHAILESGATSMQSLPAG